MEEQNISNVEDANNNEVEKQAPRQLKDYEKIEDRLKEIESLVSNEQLDMDESLKLYEEAVNLGMKASQTIENNVLADLSSVNNNK